MKKSIFNNSDYLTTIHTTHHDTDHRAKTHDKNKIHTHAVQQHLMTIPNNSILNRPPPYIDKSETELPMQTNPMTTCTATGHQIPFPYFIPPPYWSSHTSIANLPFISDGWAQYSSPFQLPSRSQSIGPSRGGNLVRFMDDSPWGDPVNLCSLRQRNNTNVSLR